MNKNWKAIFWKYATIIVVVLIVLNPEMLQLGLFIDGVGLEIFLMLLDVQVVTILATFLARNIEPLTIYIKYFCLYIFQALSWPSIKEEQKRLISVTPGPASLMHLLVLSAAISML